MKRLAIQTRLFSWLSLLVLWVGVLATLPSQADDFLEPDQAFKLNVIALNDQRVELNFKIAPGYYLYREQLKLQVQDGELGILEISDGQKKFDETFQKTVEIYRDALRVRVPVSQVVGSFKLVVTSQGCADKGLCYPPMTQTFDLSFVNAAFPSNVNASSPEPLTRLDAALQSGSFWVVVGLFFVGGLGLAFTPCVLPMLPILSSIIVGGGALPTRSRGFLLALSYAGGMALVYSALGIAAGLAGEGLVAYFQIPAVLLTFGLMLVAFSLSMFGAFELRLPPSLLNGLTRASQRLKGGRFVGVFLMGALSALLVSPCVSGVLASALLYISRSHDVILGGTALFAMAGGMSVPLLLLGLSAGSLLPQGGAWLEGVKHFFGMLLLGVALWTVQPVLPAALSQALLGALLVGAAAMLGFFQPPHAVHRPRTWLRKTTAVVSMVFGVLQLLGSAAGGTDPLRPVAGVMRAQAGADPGLGTAKLAYQAVGSVTELDSILATAGRTVMLDFYADWCVSCKEMERYTLTDSVVRQALSGVLLLKADVTANSAADRELLKRFKLFGPPGIIFFDASGLELKEARVIGFQNVERFLSSLKLANL